jgi:hypothetical protein
MAERVSPPPLPPAAASSSSITIVTDHHHGPELTEGSTPSTPNASRATTDAQQQPTSTSTSERQASSSSSSAEVEAVGLLQDSGETAVTAHKSPPAAAAGPKAEVVGAASSVAPLPTSDHPKGGLAVDDHQRHQHHKQLKEPKNKGGSIRKEKDELMLLGDGLISPSSSGMMLRAREPDEREADEVAALAPELERGTPSPSFFMAPRPPAERHTGGGGDFTPPRPTSTGDEPPSGARKERRTSLLHNLFSVRPVVLPQQARGSCLTDDTRHAVAVYAQVQPQLAGAGGQCDAGLRQAVQDSLDALRHPPELRVLADEEHPLHRRHAA